MLATENQVPKAASTKHANSSFVPFSMTGVGGSGAMYTLNGKPHHHPNCHGHKQGRWSKDEHFRFLEALKLFGKEWRRV
jgi:hypothetical protein